MILHIFKKTNVYLTCAAIIGTLLRSFAIDQRDFWFDEAFTYHIARLPLRDLFQAVLSDNNPPLYYLLIHFLLKLSSNEIILRLPSLAFSLLAIPLSYTLFKMQINKKIAVIAASLFSVSPLAIYTATEVRPHGPAVIVTMLISIAFFALIKKPNLKYSIIFIFLAILGVYTHFYTLLLFLSFTWIVVFSRTLMKISHWFLILTIIFSSLAPWLYLSIKSIHSDCACPSTILSFPASVISPAIGGVGSVTLRSFLSLPFPYLILFSATSLLALFLFLRGMHKNPLTPLYIIPITALSLFGIFLPIFSPKAFSSFSPFYFSIVAYGIYFLKKPILVLVLFVLLSTISFIQIINPFFAGERLKPAYEIVNQNQEYPVAHTSLLTYYSLSYYSHAKQPQLLITHNPLSSHTLNFIGGHKQEIKKDMLYIWLVDTKKWAEASDRAIALRKILNTYSVEKTYKIDRISVSLLKQK